MFFIPYKLDTDDDNLPIANIILIFLICLGFLLSNFTPLLSPYLEHMMLLGWNLTGLFSHIFLHFDIFHLLSNAFLLWLFGNAVNSKIGNFAFFLLFFSCTFFSAIGHIIFNGHAALGASGAIYGLIGFCLAIYPTAKLSCFWWAFAVYGVIHVPSYLLIVFWVLGDILDLIGGSMTVGNAAHLGGFIAGLVISYTFLISGYLSKENS